MDLKQYGTSATGREYLYGWAAKLLFCEKKDLVFEEDQTHLSGQSQ
jgi:hypothetical protein